MKAKAIIVIVGKRYGIKPPGWDDVAPTFPTLGDVDSAEALGRLPGGQASQEGRGQGRQGREGLTATA